MLNLHWEFAPFHKVQATPCFKAFQLKNWSKPLVRPVRTTLHKSLQWRTRCSNTATQSFTIQDLVASLLITSTKLRALNSHAIGPLEVLFCKPLCKRLLWKNNLRFSEKNFVAPAFYRRLFGK
jgi:hypothetical protein